jgi:DNA (cytosine-5)-methyltransferase 1
VWGVEYDDRIAQVARDNGLNTITADILQCDPADFEPVDFLHASPPCPNFSNAKANAEETDNDRALAAKVCEFITELLPSIFTLENVYQYRKSRSWQRIARTLLTHGYQVNYWHCNFADYGVPQTRKRMIAIARRDGITPMLPPATHSETPVNGLFERRAQWVSWYEAIEDLIPTLPDSEFAPWQLERLPDELKESLFVNCNTTGFARAEKMKGISVLSEPVQTIPAQLAGGLPRAFIAPGGNANSFSIRNGNEPARVVGDVDRVGNMPRAFIDGQQTAPDGVGGRKLTIREDGPVVTISASNYKSPHMAYTNGRIVKMTVHALARFQSFPDSYRWPDSNALATRIIGNAVPPLFAQRLCEWLI